MTPSNESDPTRARVRVLVVDDHPFFREGIIAWLGRQTGLESCGFATSVAEAHGALAALQPDLVLLDLQLPDGDGLVLLRALKLLPNGPRAIVISQKDPALFAERARHAGARGYVAKNEASDSLETAIKVVLDGGTYFGRTEAAAAGPAPLNVHVDYRDRLRGLYNRELEVLELLGRGKSTKEIAHLLGLSPKTVEYYREELKRKLGLPDALALVRFATMWQQGSGPL